MNTWHKGLTSERWGEMSLAEQMANVASEGGRTISWRNKGNTEYSRLAFERALELLTLTKTSFKKEESILKEISRVYEALADYFLGENKFGSSDELWEKYFAPFEYLAARERLE